MQRQGQQQKYSSSFSVSLKYCMCPFHLNILGPCENSHRKIVTQRESQSLPWLAFLTDFVSSAATSCSEMQKSYLYADGMNRHRMDDAQNKSSGKGETTIPAHVFSRTGTGYKWPADYARYVSIREESCFCGLITMASSGQVRCDHWGSRALLLYFFDI